MGAASAYAAVLDAIEKDIAGLLKTNPEIFGFKKIDAGFVEVRDFQTTGCIRQGLAQSPVGKQSINGHRVQVKEDYLLNAKQAIDGLVAKL